MMSDAHWKKPLEWDSEARLFNERRRVFCASMGDVFEDRKDLIEPRKRLFRLIDQTPNLDWLILTKRPGNILRLAPDGFRENVWYGTSVEDQVRHDERVEQLRAVPAKVRFLSAEPLLGPIRFNLEGIQWVIFGGESTGGRECHLDWILWGIDQCRNAGVAPFVKQLGSNPVQYPWPSSSRCKDAKGGDMTEWPMDALKVREIPS
jgi:protein gp37